MEKVERVGKVDGVDSPSGIVGVVVESLPSGLYRVRLESAGLIVAHIADRMDRNFVRILVGDRVRIELSSDVTRGRIVEKLA